jgi:Relaxase/Mobilisation nuclease domain
MTTLRTTLGKGFTGCAAYLLHDKGSRSTSERVAWSETRNTLNSDPEKAAQEMGRTASMAGYLRELTEQKQTGRKLEKPVYHLVLSWHPDDKPDQAHMTAAADSALKALGLERAQALMIAHADGGAPHLHVMVNRVNPDTGLAYSLGNDRRILSAWAKEWEKEHGLTRCMEREKPVEEREQQKSRLETQPDRQEHDPRAAEHKQETRRPDLAAELRRMHENEWQFLKEEHAEARRSLYMRQRAEGDAFYQQQREEMARARAAIEREAHAAQEATRATYKPAWREQFKNERADMRAFQELGALGRGIFYMRKFNELSPEHRGGLLAAMFNERQTMDALKGQIDKEHAAQRKEIADHQRAACSEVRRDMWERKRPELDALHERHKEQREHRRAVNAIERMELIDRQAETRREVYDLHKQERANVQRQLREAASARAKEREEADEKIRASFAPAYAVRTMSEQFKQRADALKSIEGTKDRALPKGRGFERERER